MSHAVEYGPRTEVRTRTRGVHTPAAEVHTPVRTPLLWALVGGAGLVALVAMAASASTLAELGRAIGWTQWKGWLAWSLPVSVDLLAAVSGLAWLAGGVAEEARSLGRWITVAAVTVSVALNAISHLVDSGDVQVGPWLRIGVSTVPPIVAAVALHLVVTVARGYTPADPAPTERHEAELDRPRVPVGDELDQLPLYQSPAPVEIPVHTPAAEVPTPG
ncbi:DUF2637 domain-containing protein, partial [Kitasatospora purpeofusca]|uniref:DUF2637 domain-containing protein n=1 Tax=Kitasatospora purpeofusca TaxID=67352 RepID=UPI0035D677EA